MKRLLIVLFTIVALSCSCEKEDQKSEAEILECYTTYQQTLLNIQRLVDNRYMSEFEGEKAKERAYEDYEDCIGEK